MERTVIVRVLDGLHARPATRFVKLANEFECSIEIAKGARAVSAKSAVKLMLLSVKEGDNVRLTADGPDCKLALDELEHFLSNPKAGLQEGDTSSDTLPQSARAVEPPARAVLDATPRSTVHEAPLSLSALTGIPAVEGVALGPVFAFFPREFASSGRVVPESEIAREEIAFQSALVRIRDEMTRAIAASSNSEADRTILGALQDIAQDPAIADEVSARIMRGISALDAVLGVTADAAAEFDAAADPYLKARADDMRAIGRQLCLALTGESDVDLAKMSEPAIVVAEDVGAWELSRAPAGRVLGLICAHGAATSHIAIIARAHGIPAVLGLGPLPDRLRQAHIVAMDGATGEVLPDPSEAIVERHRIRMREAAAEVERLAMFRNCRPRGADGTEIEVAANIGSEEEVDAAVGVGAMGVGLFRTELLFMRQHGLPTEDEQAAIYRRVAERFAPDAVIVRTLDVGGDKPVAGIDFPREENPFLGWRGIRMCLDQPNIFKPQLRALLRANVAGNIKVMLPMISRVDEVRRARALIAECGRELSAEGHIWRDYQLGVMIETPAAVMIAEELAKEVAFFSIGTNDLTQYIMAADRLNANLASLYDVTDPAVLAAIRATARAGVAAGIPVGMCGEAAARPELIPLFLEMGLTELSMSPSSVLRAKAIVSRLAAA